jgi:hypothetical protein
LPSPATATCASRNWREQLVAAVIGIVFLASATLRKPLIYQLARARMKRQSASKLGSFEALRDSPIFRRAMMVTTVVWGVGRVLESALCCTLVFALSVRPFLLVGPMIGYSTMGRARSLELTVRPTAHPRGAVGQIDAIGSSSPGNIAQVAVLRRPSLAASSGGVRSRAWCAKVYT